MGAGVASTKKKTGIESKAVTQQLSESIIYTGPRGELLLYKLGQMPRFKSPVFKVCSMSGEDMPTVSGEQNVTHLVSPATIRTVWVKIVHPRFFLRS